MATLTSYEGSNDDYENGGAADGNRYRAQSFQFQTNDASITGCSIWGSRGNTASGTFKAIIVSTLGGAELATTGNLTTTTALSAYGSPAWNDLTFTTPFNATKDTTYYLVIACVTGSANDEVRWSTDATSSAYTYGTMWFSSNNSSWTQTSANDKSFRIYGDVILTASSNLSNYPSFVKVGDGMIRNEIASFGF